MIARQGLFPPLIYHHQNLRGRLRSFENYGGVLTTSLSIQNLHY